MLNIRLSYTRQTDGTARMLEETNYYPFGLRHAGYDFNSIVNNTYRYKYNGKEVQENGMYDFGARMYMPELGRWGVVDPLAETSRRYSPYAYALNNPMRFIDPDGRSAMDSFYNYHNYSNENRPMFSTDDDGNMYTNPIYQHNSYIDATGAVGGGTVGELMDNLGITSGTIESYMQFGFVLNLMQQLKLAGWDDPAHTKAKFSDLPALLEKLPSLKELYTITKAEFIDYTGGNRPNKTVYEKISINMNNIENILKFAFTAGHEMNHSFADLFFRDKFSEITKQPKSSIPFRNSFGFFQEAMGLSWEINLGSERYGNLTGLQAAEFFYGPNGLGYSQKSVDTVKTYFYDLKAAWNLMYRSKLK